MTGWQQFSDESELLHIVARMSWIPIEQTGTFTFTCKGDFEKRYTDNIVSRWTGKHYQNEEAGQENSECNKTNDCANSALVDHPVIEQKQAGSSQHGLNQM